MAPTILPEEIAGWPLLSIVYRTDPDKIALAGALDPIAFWPHADTIGGSRWPGDRGGPRFS
jgi:hypothetical protein